MEAGSITGAGVAWATAGAGATRSITGGGGSDAAHSITGARTAEVTAGAGATYSFSGAGAVLVTAGSGAAHSITGPRSAEVTAGASATCSPSGTINQNEERDCREQGQTNYEGCHRQKIEIGVRCRLEHGENKQENEHEHTNQGVPVAPSHPDSVGTKMMHEAILLRAQQSEDDSSKHCSQHLSNEIKKSRPYTENSQQ